MGKNKGPDSTSGNLAKTQWDVANTVAENFPWQKLFPVVANIAIVDVLLFGALIWLYNIAVNHSQTAQSNDLMWSAIVLVGINGIAIAFYYILALYHWRIFLSDK